MCIIERKVSVASPYEEKSILLSDERGPHAINFMSLSIQKNKKVTCVNVWC